MKTNPYIIVLSAILLISSCSNSECVDTNLSDNNANHKIYWPQNINFENSDFIEHLKHYIDKRHTKKNDLSVIIKPVLYTSTAILLIVNVKSNKTLAEFDASSTAYFYLDGTKVYLLTPYDEFTGSNDPMNDFFDDSTLSSGAVGGNSIYMVFNLKSRKFESNTDDALKSMTYWDLPIVNEPILIIDQLPEDDAH